MATMANLDLTQSTAAFAAAQRVLPGGVNSPVRAFRGVGGTPVFIKRGAGSRFEDLDGNSYLDYVLSWGPLILGHAHPAVLAAIVGAASGGSTFGAPTLAETALAEEIIALYPGVETVRLVSSGTEATMSALRLARAFTGRDRIIKFAGCYHGHADLLLVQAGSGIATLGLPDSPGVPAGATADTLVAPFNDLAAVEALFQQFPGRIAGVIVEPVAGNMGVVPPVPGFLEGLRDVTQTEGALLIFDEVMTGFRVSLGGAAQLFGVTPDVVTLGKVVGGGLPLAAYAGRRDVMATVAPAGPMYQGGTLSGNPVATAAGLATLRALQEPGVFDTIVARTARLADGVTALASAAGILVQTVSVGTMAGIFFADAPVRNYDDARTSDTARYGRFFHGLLRRGVYLAPSQFEALFLSAAHTEGDIDETLDAVGETLREIG